MAELMRAIVQARCASVAVIALVGGKSGAFGGTGLTAATCSRIVISEQGRIGVSGPEVIETNKGSRSSMPRTKRWYGVPTAAKTDG
jgi:malonate decarboxylase beta subunit